MELAGWTKSWRKKWENPSLRGRINHLVVWSWIIDHAVYDGQRSGTSVRFQGVIIELQPGQLTCGSNQIAADTGVASSTVRRVIGDLVREQLIEQRSDHQCSLITVKNWDMYQGDEQRMSKDRATSEQRVSTKEEEKKVRSKEITYVARPETDSLFEFIDQLCTQYALDNGVNRKSLDILVGRYLQKVQMRVEVQHCISWLVSKDLKKITAERLGNWFKKSMEIAKRQELRNVEWRQAHKDPYIAQKAREQKAIVPKQELFVIDPAVKKYIHSQPSNA